MEFVILYIISIEIFLSLIFLQPEPKTFQSTSPCRETKRRTKNYISEKLIYMIFKPFIDIYTKNLKVFRRKYLI